MSEPLPQAEIDAALEEMPGWSHTEDCLQRDIKLPTFRDAVALIVRISFEAEEMDHHPELENVYNRISIRLTSHDADRKVTARDLVLARKIEALL